MIKTVGFKGLTLSVFLTYAASNFAQEPQTNPTETKQDSNPSITEQIGDKIEETLEKTLDIEVTDIIKEEQDDDSVLSERINAERNIINNSFAITPHKANYLLPITYVSDPNSEGNVDLTPENIQNTEAKYQVSIKLPLYIRGEDTDGLYFGFTLQSFWQVYNAEVSRPFRETNYEPEVYYQWESDYEIFGLNFNLLQAGYVHQSNGQSGLQSRSWDRLYLTSVFSTERNFYYLKFWYRFPEDEKEFPLDPTGDDNPDIEDFIGRMEVGYGRQFEKWRLTMRLRNNLSFEDNRGSVEVNATYPISNRYYFMIQYFNGYGDSLIDYNRFQERIGVGIQLKLL